MTNPTFVCIGAQRSGTTWLDAHLRQHPRIWMPPVKELHFLSAPRSAPFILSPRLFGVRDKRHLLMHRKRVWYAAAQLRRLRHARWALRYLLLPRSVRMYPLLFSPGRGQIAGEVTPSYAPIREEKIRQVRRLLPDLKIMYLLRDPVERIWSHVAMMLGKKHHLVADHDDDDLLHTFVVNTFASFRFHSSYSANLQRWEASYPPEQMYVGFFEQVVQEPEALLSSIYRFLEVEDVPHYSPTQLHQPRNMWVFRPMPQQTKRWVTEQMMPEYQGLHARFANVYTERWLRKAESVLDGGA